MQIRTGLFSFCFLLAFVLLSTTEALTPFSSFHFISSSTHRVRGGQQEVQRENLEPGTLSGGRAVAPQSLGSQKPSLQCATSSSAFSQRELPLCKLAGRAGGVGERVGQEACLVSSWRGDPGGVGVEGRRTKAVLVLPDTFLASSESPVAFRNFTEEERAAPGRRLRSRRSATGVGCRWAGAGVVRPLSFCMALE